jgi:hypothetical protein
MEGRLSCLNNHLTITISQTMTKCINCKHEIDICGGEYLHKSASYNCAAEDCLCKHPEAATSST